MVAQLEGGLCGLKTRMEDTILFIQEIGAKYVGITTCLRLNDDEKILAKILRILSNKYELKKYQ